MAIPKVSVIIATYNRADTLCDTLASLAAQTYPQGSYEVIVVDDNSTDATGNVVNACLGRFYGNLKYIKKEVNEGPGKTRNRGAEVASGEIIAFTDSDCFVDKDWIKNGISAFTDEAAFVQGKTLPDPRKKLTFRSRTIQVLREDGMYETCNIFYRKKVFNEAGGFAMHYRRAKDSLGNLVSGVDVDLAWRVKKKGYTCVFAPSAVVYHHVFERTFLQALIEPYRVYIIPHLIRQYPEVRKYVSFFRIFHTKSSFLFDVSLVAAAGAVFINRWIALLVVPYIFNHLKSIFPGRPLSKYGHGAALFFIYIVQDAICCVSLLRSSWKFKTILL